MCVKMCLWTQHQSPDIVSKLTLSFTLYIISLFLLLFHIWRFSCKMQNSGNSESEVQHFSGLHSSYVSQHLTPFPRGFHHCCVTSDKRPPVLIVVVDGFAQSSWPGVAFHFLAGDRNFSRSKLPETQRNVTEVEQNKLNALSEVCSGCISSLEVITTWTC